MRPDHNSTLSDAQTIIASTPSTNCLKVGTNTGKGHPLTFLFTVMADFLRAAGDIGTVISLQCSNCADGGYDDVKASQSFTKEQLIRGFQTTLTLPAVHAAWVQAYYTNANPADSGKITCQLIETEQGR
jgi:hypothetical protein